MSERDLRAGPHMPKARVLIIGAAVTGLLCVPFLFLGRGSSHPVSLHFLRTQRFDDAVDVKFAISNDTGHVYKIFPLRLERQEGSAWKECPHGIYRPRAEDVNGKLTCSMAEQPSGSRLRVVVLSHRVRGGLDGYLYRAIISIRGQGKNLSLNPLIRTVSYTDPVEIVSEEFTVP